MEEINSCACGKRCFTLHFNRDKKETTGELEWLIHYDGKSESVKHFKCNAAVEGRFNASTPNAVIHGIFESIEIIDGVAHIN